LSILKKHPIYRWSSELFARSGEENENGGSVWGWIVRDNSSRNEVFELPRKIRHMVVFEMKKAKRKLLF